MPLESPIDASVEEIRRILAPIRHPFSVALYAPGNAFSVGAIIRTAHNFLAREILLIGTDPFYEKAAMGMDKYESVVRLGAAEELFAYANGRPIWALEKDHASISLTAVTRIPDDVIFLFGSERDGIPSTVVAACDRAVGIPIFGINHSLPVTVAAGVTMYEWTRRYYEAGRVR